MIVFVLIVSFPFHIPFTVDFFYLWKYHLMRSGKAKVMQINRAGLVAMFNSPPLGNPGPPRARENQNGPKRVRPGGRVNEAALN